MPQENQPTKRAQQPERNERKTALWTIIALVLVVAIVVILALRATSGPGDVVTTTIGTVAPTTKPQPTVTTKPRPSAAELAWSRNLTAYRTAFDKVFAGSRTPTKAKLVSWVATLKGCNLAKFGTQGSRLTLAAVQAQAGCDNAKAADARFTTALRYVARKDKPGKAALKLHADAGLKLAGIAHGYLVTAERTTKEVLG
jgi:hypothetical protein